MKLRIARRAECELDRIQEFYERTRGSSQRIIEMFDDAFQHLLQWPRSGHHRLDFVDEEYRFWRVESYLVVYLVEDPWLVVATILHASRDLAKELEFLA